MLADGAAEDEMTMLLWPGTMVAVTGQMVVVSAMVSVMCATPPLVLLVRTVVV